MSTPAPEETAAAETVETTPPIQLPDDHPLVTTLASQKEQIKQLKAAQIDPAELQRLRDLDESSKTEAQKAAERLAELETKVKDYETREQINAWKAEVATATGVPANVLAGSTKEEIEAHAATLKPLIEQAQAAPAQPAPGVVPTIGNTPTVPNTPLDDLIAEAEKAGDIERSIALKQHKAALAAKGR